MNKTFYQKLKHFIRRHAYSITVSFCLVFALSVVSSLAVLQIQKSSRPIPEDVEEVVVPDDEEEIVPVVTTPIVFKNPVANASAGLPYAENYLVYFKTLNKWQTHLGVDFVAIAGTKVVAAYEGKIDSIENTVMEGTVIVITHSDKLQTVYKSLSDDVLVNEGDTVKAGDEIGYVSAKHKAEEDLGSHLHFEVLLDGKYVDPANYLPGADK